MPFSTLRPLTTSVVLIISALQPKYPVTALTIDIGDTSLSNQTSNLNQDQISIFLLKFIFRSDVINHVQVVSVMMKVSGNQVIELKSGGCRTSHNVNCML